VKVPQNKNVTRWLSPIIVRISIPFKAQIVRIGFISMFSLNFKRQRYIKC